MQLNICSYDVRVFCFYSLRLEPDEFLFRPENEVVDLLGDITPKADNLFITISLCPHWTSQQKTRSLINM